MLMMQHFSRVYRHLRLARSLSILEELDQRRDEWFWTFLRRLKQVFFKEINFFNDLENSGENQNKLGCDFVKMPGDLT